MMLLAGDLFDGPATDDACRILYKALAQADVPVFIAPGNHDFAGPDSPWLTRSWPDNVHIFTRPVLESVMIPRLNCEVYGAGFSSMDCPGLLEGFRAQSNCRYAIGVLHGDPSQSRSPYCPVTRSQVMDSALDYLALGHIHKGGSFQAGSTLCAWPGCPMGRGFDETGEKGVLIVTLEDTVQARFLPLDFPNFFDLIIPSPQEPVQALRDLLPPVGSEDFYRITFTGTPDVPLDPEALMQSFSQFPNLTILDETLPPVDIWSALGEDSFEGLYFSALQKAMEETDEDTRRRILLAARISRQILDGREVVLP